MAELCLDYGSIVPVEEEDPLPAGRHASDGLNPREVPRPKGICPTMAPFSKGTKVLLKHPPAHPISEPGYAVIHGSPMNGG